LVNHEINLSLFFDRFIDKVMQDVRTDGAGIARVRLGRNLPAGQHRLYAFSSGDKHVRGSLANATLVVQPSVLTVNTVPPIADIKFSLEGSVFSTGADGRAHITVERPGTHRLEVLPSDNDASKSRVAFVRWEQNIFVPYRDVDISGDRVLEAGFELSHLVTLAFHDLLGETVAPKRITSTTFKSSYGMTYSFQGAAPMWMQANRIVGRTWGLEEKKFSYALESVFIDGSNVVNRGQQRFLVEPNATWSIETLLYFARFRALDAVFGFPLGEGITMEYPDGRVEKLRFGPDNEIEVGPLARGLYTVQVVGARGAAPPTPVALSRDQYVELKVLSTLDMGVGLTLGIVGALGLLFWGRPYLMGLNHLKALSSLFRSSRYKRHSP
jgi:hypothetical protein